MHFPKAANRRLLAVLGGAAAAIGLSACGAQSGEADPARPVGGGAEGYVQEYQEQDRVAVQDFSATLLGGGSVDSEDLAGQVTVVNVWGSWCTPCRAEAPVLSAASRRYASEGVGFLGLNVRDNEASALAFEKRFDVPYPSITTEDSPRVSLAFGGQLVASAVPTTLVLDAERHVAARVTGQISASTLRTLVETTLAAADHDA